jgi:hypothetical protein
LGESQKNKIQKAFAAEMKAITIHLSKDSLEGDDLLNLTKIQYSRLRLKQKMLIMKWFE